MDAGAYGFTMASNYNRRPLPAEVLVDAVSPGHEPGATGAPAPAHWHVIRRRQTVEDLLALES
jgi:diaminopimelate decarboxylase